MMKEPNDDSNTFLRSLRITTQGFPQEKEVISYQQRAYKQH